MRSSLLPYGMHLHGEWMGPIHLDNGWGNIHMEWRTLIDMENGLVIAIQTMDGINLNVKWIGHIHVNDWWVISIWRMYSMHLYGHIHMENG